ncbi:MAG: ATP phosphoribosyltransferase [Candidatus Omnitrophota bacterium]|nr:ATP phosphoribosyltransferase [Candidatus Omnitrophota bacterium]MBU1929795.1 ATP phosphoribosyltransferase [Candidatus Omnitrophota bacterium]MBU2035203.1 ATP phosphoribosyltransferase [Candidatus Omnitrophota bacterium]MBU2221501.1 ATP phosphoribosyltransferase [Candidatus Omnitrophota bacterium]MBU2258508.1 ATP phosphoribosyltransferase [Candidatus Omnitrophota bacterium]
MKKDKVLKIGLPKGSLQESTFKMFRKAGFNVALSSERSYFPSIDDPQIEPILLRAQEMSRYIEDQALDCGITGNDWIMENKSNVVRVTDLIYAKQGLNKVRWVLAVPECSGIKSLKQLSNKRIATELVNVTTDFFRRNKVKVEVEFSWGATEVKVNSGLVDAIVELTETGRSLKANKLIEIATVCESTTQFIANKEAYKNGWKRAKMEEIAILLKGAIAAEEKVGLKMNVKKADLEDVIKLLPALKKPTVSGLSSDGWFAIDTVIDERVVRTLIPGLKRAGAEGIIEYPLNKVIY